MCEQKTGRSDFRISTTNKNGLEKFKWCGNRIDVGVVCVNCVDVVTALLVETNATTTRMCQVRTGRRLLG